MKHKGMGEYSLQSMPLSPKSYGKLTSSQSQTPQKALQIFDGAFVRAGTLSEEIEDKDILNWLYKDEEETKATPLEITPHKAIW